jgi:hypothetical protein
VPDDLRQYTTGHNMEQVGAVTFVFAVFTRLMNRVHSCQLHYTQIKYQLFKMRRNYWCIALSLIILQNYLYSETCIRRNLNKAEIFQLFNVNKFNSPGQKNQCYLYCIMRKFVQCGKYFRSHAVPPYTSFTVYIYIYNHTTQIWILQNKIKCLNYVDVHQPFTFYVGVFSSVQSE